MIRPSSPGEPDHIWYVSLERFWGNSPKLELKTWTAGNPVTWGCGAACVHTPHKGTWCPGWESAYTARQRRLLGPPLNGRELVFPRHLLSNVLYWAMLTQRLRSLLVTSDCVFFRGG